jgi:hypothetical protein
MPLILPLLLSCPYGKLSLNWIDSWPTAQHTPTSTFQA